MREGDDEVGIAKEGNLTRDPHRESMPQNPGMAVQAAGAWL